MRIYKANKELQTLDTKQFKIKRDGMISTTDCLPEDFNVDKELVVGDVPMKSKTKKKDKPTDEVVLLSDKDQIFSTVVLPVNKDRSFVGYITTEDGLYLRLLKDKPVWLLPLIIGLCLFLAADVLFIISLLRPDNTPTLPQRTTEAGSIALEGDDPFNGKPYDPPTGDEGMVSIPCYSKLTLSSNNQSVSFGNPEENDVAIKYTFYKGSDIIYETGYVAPGKTVYVNLYELVNMTTTDLKVIAQPYVIETGMPTDVPISYDVQVVCKK